MDRGIFIAMACVALLGIAPFALAEGGGISLNVLSPEETTTYEKNGEIRFLADVSFPSGSEGMNVEAAVQRGVSAEKIPLFKNAEGLYEGTYLPGYGTQLNSPVSVSAGAEISGQSLVVREEFTLSLAPAEIGLDFELFPEPPYYVGSVVERIKINAFYPDGSRVPLANLERQPRLGINQDRISLRLSEDGNGALVSDVGYAVAMSENLGNRNNWVEAELQDLMNDKYGNRAGNARKEFEILSSHASLSVRIIRPVKNENIFPGIELPFEIELAKGQTVKNERVYLAKGTEIGEKRECEKISEAAEKLIFRCVETTPSMEDAHRLVYIALATAEVEGREITVYDAAEHEISNEVELRQQFPREGNTGLGEIEDIVAVNFFYGRNNSLEGGSYIGTIDGAPVTFTWDSEREAYVTPFALSELGEGGHDLEISVQGLDLMNNTISFGIGEGDFFGEGKGPDLIELVVMLIVVLGAFTVVIWFLVLRKKGERSRTELEDEAAVLKELLKKVEIDFFKRRLTEDDYKKRTLEYRTRLEKVQARLGMKRKTASPEPQKNI